MNNKKKEKKETALSKLNTPQNSNEKFHDLKKKIKKDRLSRFKDISELE